MNENDENTVTSAEGRTLTLGNILSSMRVPEFSPEKMLEKDMKEAVKKLRSSQEVTE